MITTKLATRIATGFLYATVAAIPVSIMTSPAAHADTPRDPAQTVTSDPLTSRTPAWTSHDKKVMKAANKTCKKITDDVTFEFCVIGAFHLNDAGSSSGRVITDEDYTYNNHGRIVLLQADGSVA